MIVSGEVIKNKGRGKLLGYPTANLNCESKDLEEGVYIGTTLFAENEMPSLIFIGKPVTFDEDEKEVGVHILDFNKDIYGKNLKVMILKKIRDNIKFDSKEKLIMQMRQDEKVARDYFFHNS